MRNEAQPELARLSRRFRPALMAFFLRRLRNHAEAEDLTQEVFVRLATTDRGPMDSADAYIFRIAANMLSDRSRREKVRAAYRTALWADDSVGVDPLDPARVADARGDVAAVVAALKDLPERTRAIFVLYRLENMDKRSIADSLSISTSAVDKHLMRAQAHIVRAVRGEL
ncbi:MAG: sigma-70 family RNA polymerase sigma factor [Caulobacteraceae bacterium]|nr:sigma-70 family RNA polymerase sigma factor [Caulobacteraceae bacterium]